MQIYFHGTLRALVGGRVIDVSIEADQTVYQLLRAAVDEYPALENRFFTEDGDLTAEMLITLNGRNVRVLEGLETVIPAKARINIFPFFRTTSVGKNA